MEIPFPIAFGDEMKIEYRGYLAQAGAEPIYLHYGFGSGPWEQVAEIPMEKTDDGVWTASVLAQESGQFNFCFRDDVAQWDNNHGRDWSYAIQDEE